MGLLDCDNTPARWCPTTKEDALQGILGLLPQGPVWDAANVPGTMQNKFWSAIAQTTAYAFSRLCAYVDEFHCSTLVESLDQWMEEYGLPNDCDPSGNNLCLKVTMVGGQDCTTFVEVARRFGYVIECEDLPLSTNYAGCFEVGCTMLGVTPTYLAGANTGFGKLCSCDYGEGTRHPEPEFWESSKAHRSHCPVPGSNLGETSGDPTCCFIVGYYDSPAVESAALQLNACGDPTSVIVFDCPETPRPSAITAPCDGTGNYAADYGGAYHWRVRVLMRESAALRHELYTPPTPEIIPLNNAGNFQVGCTPLCSPLESPATVLCFLEEIKPAHTILHTEIVHT